MCKNTIYFGYFINYSQNKIYLTVWKSESGLCEMPRLFAQKGVAKGRIRMPNDDARNNMSSVKVLCQLWLSTH
jgi:hypothetical protein